MGKSKAAGRAARARAKRAVDNQGQDIETKEDDEPLEDASLGPMLRPDPGKDRMNLLFSKTVMGFEEETKANYCRRKCRQAIAVIKVGLRYCAQFLLCMGVPECLLKLCCVLRVQQVENDEPGSDDEDEDDQSGDEETGEEFKFRKGQTKGHLARASQLEHLGRQPVNRKGHATDQAERDQHFQFLQTLRITTLDEVGARQDPPTLWYRIQCRTGLTDLRVEAAVRNAEISMWGGPRAKLHERVQSLSFDALFAVLIVGNAITTCLEFSYTESPVWVTALDNILLVVFVMEIFIRYQAGTWVWLFDTSNLFDITVIVVTGVVPNWILKPMGITTGIASLLRGLAALRILRISRLIKRLRTFPMFKELWTLVRGVMDCLRVLCSSALIGLVLHYMFAIVVLQTITKSSVFIDNEHVQELFPDLGRTAFTLFQIMTFSTWAAALRPIIYALPVSLFLWFLWMGIASIVLANMITAVVVKSSMDAMANDTEASGTQKMIVEAKSKGALYLLFHELDEDQSGALDKDEFTKVLDDVKFVRKLKTLDVELDELPDIFEILDDGDGEISIHEFCYGLSQMSGPAMSREVMKASQRIRRLTREIDVNEKMLGVPVVTFLDDAMSAFDLTHKVMCETMQIIPKVLQQLNQAGVRRLLQTVVLELPSVSEPALEFLLQKEAKVEQDRLAALRRKDKRRQKHSRRHKTVVVKTVKVKNPLPASWVRKRRQDLALTHKELVMETAEKMIDAILKEQDKQEKPGEVVMACQETWDLIQVQVPKPKPKTDDLLRTIAADGRDLIPAPPPKDFVPAPPPAHPRLPDVLPASLCPRGLPHAMIRHSLPAAPPQQGRIPVPKGPVPQLPGSLKATGGTSHAEALITLM